MYAIWRRIWFKGHPRQWHLSRSCQDPGGGRDLWFPQDALHEVEKIAPLRRNISIEDVANAAAFLCSDPANGITGVTTYVNYGYSIMGMRPLDA